MSDSGVRDEARAVLGQTFGNLGHAIQGQTTDPLGGLAGSLGTQIEQFLQMPIELAQIFTSLGMQMADLVLTALEEAGIVLARGLMP
jgi:hypothetical protein